MILEGKKPGQDRGRSWGSLLWKLGKPGTGNSGPPGYDPIRHLLLSEELKLR